MYKIKAGKPEKGWGGNQPKNWEDFDIDSNFGVRKCGTDNFKCDLCNHVRGNPVGTSSSGSNVLRSRGREKTVVQPKEKSPPNRCGSCLGEIRRGVKQKCSQASKKKNILEMIRTDSVEMQKQIVGSTLRSLAMLKTRQATKKGPGHNETVMLGRVMESHNFTVSVGKEETKGGFLTANTFRKI